jgi:protein SCO1/2
MTGARPRLALAAAASLALLAAAASLALLACRPDNVHEGRGVVREVDRAERQVVIEHEDIPGLMPAMTMSFDVADPALLDSLEPGQHVEFELLADGAHYRILRARKEGGRAGAVRSPLLSGGVAEADPAPDFSLVDQSGERVSLASLRGRAVVLDFVFTQCRGPCPALTGLHVDLQRSLGPALRERVRFVSISLDPANDTPEALRAYAEARGADLATWSFLTGPAAEVEDVVRRFGVGTLRAADGTLEHIVATFLIDGHGRIARRWIGLDHPLDAMRAELARVAAAPPGPAS